MVSTRGGLSLSVTVLAASQLLYNPAGHAQAASPGEPVPAQGGMVAPPQPGPPPAYGPVVTLRADNPRARLQILNQQLRWQDVCVSPCNVPVNPAGSYRVGGGTIRASETFSLPQKQAVLIDAEVGSTVKHWVGIGLIIGGIGSALAGSLVYAAGNDQPDFNGSTTNRDAAHAAGIVYIVVGVVLLAVGIPLSLSSTSVEVH